MTLTCCHRIIVCIATNLAAPLITFTTQLARAFAQDLRRGGARFIDVKQNDLTHRSAHEDAIAAEARASGRSMDPNAAIVPTKRWDVGKGETTSVEAPSKLQKRKHQVHVALISCISFSTGIGAPDMPRLLQFSHALFHVQINTLAMEAKAATMGAAAMKLHAVTSKKTTAGKYGW